MAGMALSKKPLLRKNPSAGPAVENALNSAEAQQVSVYAVSPQLMNVFEGLRS